MRLETIRCPAVATGPTDPPVHLPGSVTHADASQAERAGARPRGTPQ